MSRATLDRLIVAAMLLAWPASRTVYGQAADPRGVFLNALGQFSLTLDGTYGDEGRPLAAGLDAMAAALARWDASVQNSERAMRAEVGSAEPTLASRMHLALAGVYLDRVRVSEALEELAAARKSDPTRPDVPLLEGVTHTQLTGNAAAATEALKAAHGITPQDPVRTYLLARQLIAANQQDAGLALLQQIRHPPGQTAAPTVPPFVRLDLVHETPGLEPFLPPTSYAEGFASLQRGDLANAIAQLRESLRRDPLATSSDDNAIARAAAAFRDGLLADARKQLESVVAQSPDRAEAQRLLGMIDLADGETARGIGRLRTAAGLNPSDERTRLALANALVENDQLDEAEQALREALRTLAGSGRAHYLLGLTYQRQGKRPEALRELQAALELRPLLGANTIARMIGTLQQDEQDLDAAARTFATRVDLVPNDHDAHRDLGKVYLLQGEDVRARAEFEVALLVDPSDVEASTSLGQLDLRAGRYEDAATVSRRALELDPADREARYVHATALIRMGNAAEGAAEMEVFQRLQAEDSESRARSFELGRLRREASVSLAGGDRANAVALLRRALVYEPRSATSHLDLGLALLESGQAAEAIERLNTAVALNAPLDVHRHLAKAYAAMGQNEESQKEQAIYERLRRESIRKTGRAR